MKITIIAASIASVLSVAPTFAADYSTGVQIGNAPTAAQKQFRAQQRHVAQKVWYEYQPTHPFTKRINSGHASQGVPARHHQYDGDDASVITYDAEQDIPDSYDNHGVGDAVARGVGAGLGWTIGRAVGQALF